ncbi:unnamed protein product [Heterobilharzia americana]|nr:unnamed protein product [Heterobilharzia americana]
MSTCRCFCKWGKKEEARADMEREITTLTNLEKREVRQQFFSVEDYKASNPVRCPIQSILYLLMVTCYLGVSSKFRVSCHSFKKLLVTPFRAARTKWIGNLSEELSKDKAGVSERKTQESNAHHCEKSTDVVACRNLLDDLINDEPVGRHTFGGFHFTGHL